MTKDEFERLADLFQSEIRSSTERLGESIQAVRIEGQERGKRLADQITELGQRQTAMKMQIQLVDERQFELEKRVSAFARGSQAQGLEQDAAVASVKSELDDVKAQILTLRGQPKKHDSKAPTTLAAIGEAQVEAKRSRWIPIAIAVATFIGTVVNVIIHK